MEGPPYGCKVSCLLYTSREEINAVGGYYAFGKELCNGDSVFDFDTTKLSVHTPVSYTHLMLVEDVFHVED